VPLTAVTNEKKSMSSSSPSFLYNLFIEQRELAINLLVSFVDPFSIKALTETSSGVLALLGGSVLFSHLAKRDFGTLSKAECEQNGIETASGELAWLFHLHQEASDGVVLAERGRIKYFWLMHIKNKLMRSVEGGASNNSSLVFLTSTLDQYAYATALCVIALERISALVANDELVRYEAHKLHIHKTLADRILRGFASLPHVKCAGYGALTMLARKFVVISVSPDVFGCDEPSSLDMCEGISGILRERKEMGASWSSFPLFDEVIKFCINASLHVLHHKKKLLQLQVPLLLMDLLETTLCREKDASGVNLITLALKNLLDPTTISDKMHSRAVLATMQAANNFCSSQSVVTKCFELLFYLTSWRSALMCPNLKEVIRMTQKEFCTRFPSCTVLSNKKWKFLPSIDK